jgi:Protein of unknown function (DUF4197)
MKLKNVIFSAASAVLLTSCGTGIQSQDVWKAVNDVATQMGDGSGSTAAPTQNEIVRGLKEALQQGTNKGSDKLSAADGFFKDAAVKILMPPEAKNVEEKLRALGLGSLVDDAILSFNRGAEKASVKAKPIFVDAITQMSISDAMGILKGGGTSATDYLKRATTNQLVQAFKPTIQLSLNEVNATKYWSDVMSAYNKIPFVQPVNTDLAGFVTQRAVDGIFLKIADEERNIRANPMQQVSALLKKVFTYATKK